MTRPKDLFPVLTAGRQYIDELMSSTEGQLISEFATQGSEAAFAALVRQHANLVFATALRQVGDRALAEDITQNVFLTLARSAGKLGRHPTLAGWLYHTTLNKSREAFRSELRRQRREQAAVAQALEDIDGDSVWAAMLPLVDEALLELAEPDRLAVVLHYLEGRTFPEVGAALGVGEDAARKRASRCLDQLTAFYRRHGFACPALAASAPLFTLATHPAPTGLAETVSAAVLSKATLATHPSTLINGALKIMAWTKTKTAVVAGIVVLLGAGGTGMVKYHSAHRPHIQTSTAVLELESDGTIHRTETIAKENYSGQPWTILSMVTVTDSTNSDFVQRITDGAGHSVPFTTTKKGGKTFYEHSYSHAVRPGGKLVETVEGVDHDSIQPDAEPGVFICKVPAMGDFQGDCLTRQIETIRLPPGAVLLDKEPADATVATNGDRIDIKFDKTIPVNSALRVRCRYRLSGL